MDVKAHPDEAGSGGDEQAELLARRAAFGGRMRALREEHGMSLDSLAETTRIGLSFLQAIESGNLEKLPGYVFGRGFVQNVAKNFGADPAPLLAAFGDLWEQAPPRSVLKVQIKNKPVKQRSEAWMRLTTTTSSLVRRGILVKIVVPLAVLGLVIYALASRPFLRQAVQSLRGSGSVVAVIKAKPLDLRARPEAAVQAPGVTNSSGNMDPSATRVAAVSAAPKAAVATSAAMMEPALIDGARWPVVTPAEVPGEGVATDAGENATHLPIPAPTAEAGEQVLVLTVSDPVRIRLDVDHGPSVTKELVPDTYRFAFSQRADLMIYDAAAVKISFNGRALGTLGSKGRVRRLSFQSQAQKAKTF